MVVNSHQIKDQDEVCKRYFSNSKINCFFSTFVGDKILDISIFALFATNCGKETDRECESVTLVKTSRSFT